MQRLFLVLILCMPFTGQSRPQAFFHYKVYYTPDHQPYVSTSLQFSGGTFKYKATEGGLVANVEITQVFRHNDSVVFFDKYLLSSPVMADSIVEDFYDVQRYGIAPGIYDYELIIRDVISGEIVSAEQSIRVDDFKTAEIQFSDIEFIEDARKTDEQNNFVKNGFFTLPYMTNYFPPEISKIAFYFEVYNADNIVGAGKNYLLTYSIVDFESRLPVEGIFKFQRTAASPITPVIAYLPIDSLPSGQYDLQINMVNENNDTVYSRDVYFQRRNVEPEYTALSIESIQIDKSFETLIPRDSIPYFLGSIMPISPGYEYETIRVMLKGTDTTAMAKYFYAYWLKTSPMEPYLAWLRYKERVRYAETLFGTQIKSGWETDRGRIYLKYGAPDALMERPNEPGAYPYEIWQYYRIGQRSDVKFIFYNPDLATNDYPLLHSDMQGELQNYRWDWYLYGGSPNRPVDPASNGSTIHYGGNANTYFINP